MALNLAQVDICNLALLKLGQLKIQSITNQNDPNAVACNVAWPQALGEVSREGPWNCLKTPAALVQVSPPNNPSPPPQSQFPAGTTPWAPNTNYVVNQYVTFGYPQYLYQCLIANTSGSSFPQDLTKGYWFQTDVFSPNFWGASSGNAGPLVEWAFSYQLPTDFILLLELNGKYCWGYYQQNTQGSLYEIYQKILYCNQPFANIKYNQYQTDTTALDTLFIAALVLKLAALIATHVRKDDATLSQRLTVEYKDALGDARVKNALESQPHRYNIVSQSRFVRSRFWSTNG